MKVSFRLPGWILITIPLNKVLQFPVVKAGIKNFSNFPVTTFRFNKDGARIGRLFLAWHRLLSARF